ncbi:AAA+ ATPase domain-containing protein [Tanacetum coccineum]
MDSNLNNENDQWELSLDIDDSDLRLTPVLRPSSSKRVEKSSEDEDFKSGSWFSATDYVNANGGTSCSPNVIGDLTVTMKDLLGSIPRTIHHKVIGEGGYGKDITVGAVLILANVLVLSPKPSMHYLNITMRNVVKVFCKDTVPGSGSG